MFARSLVRRHTQTFIFFSACNTVLIAVAMLVLAYVVEDRVLQQLLATEAEHIQQSRAQSPAKVRSAYVNAYMNTEHLPSLLREQALQDTRGELYVGESYFHFQWTHTLDGRPVLLVADVTSLLSVRAISGQLLILLGFIFASVLGIAIALSYKLARWTTDPVLELAEHAQTASRKLGVDAKGRYDGSELDYLYSVIDNALSQTKEVLLREQAFNRDLSHELRTPLTILNNQLSLCEPDKISRADIDIMQSALAEVSTIVSVLLMMARAESISPQPLSVSEVLERCLLKREEHLQRVSLAGPDQPVWAQGVESLASLLIGNLMDNAIKHGAGEVRITLTDSDLCIRNQTIEGVAGEPLMAGEQSAGSDGIGQGLYLARRIAKQLHWTLSVIQEHSEFIVRIQFV